MTNITYDFLVDNGECYGSVNQGTVVFYEYEGECYTVLCDNTVIKESPDEWDEWRRYYAEYQDEE